MTLIAPSMLAADFLHLEKDVQLVNDYADIFHLDVMDGTFVPNISYGFPVVEAIARSAEKPMDVHLMIVNPDKYVERFAALGVEMISFHLEAVSPDGTDAQEEEVDRILAHIRACGAKAGLVVNPDIPVERLFPHLENCDFVLIMSVFAGFGGQTFIEETYGRIRSVKAEIIRQGLNVSVEVDGGVGPKNAKALAEAGASILVAGSAVFKASDPQEVINQMK